MNYGQLNTLQRYVEDNYDFSDFVKELWQRSFSYTRNQLYGDVLTLIDKINNVEKPLAVDLNLAFADLLEIDSLQELKMKIEKIKNAPPYRSPVPVLSTFRNYEEFVGYLTGQMTELLNQKGLINIKESGEILITALPTQTELGRKIIERGDFLVVLMRIYTDLYVPLLEEYWTDVERYFNTIETLIDILRIRRISNNKGSK